MSKPVKLSIVGGGGFYVRPVLSAIANFDEVDELVLVGRRREALDQLIQELGIDATAVEADIFDDNKLRGALAGSDLVVNASGPYFKTLMPVLLAAIDSGAHYCDYSEDWAAVQQARKLDDEVKSKGLTALLGFGDDPGLGNLLAVHGASQLDSTESIVMGWVSEVEATVGDIGENLQSIDESGSISGSLQSMFNGLIGEIPVLRDGKITAVRSLQEPTGLVTPSGEVLMAYPFGTAEPVTLPNTIKGVREITSVIGLLPVQANQLMADLCVKIESGDITLEQGVREFFHQLDQERTKWLGDGGPTGFFVSGVSITGSKDGQRMRWSGAFRWNWDTITNAEGISTSGTMALAAKKLLAGEIDQTGVLAPEECLDPLPFLEELTQQFELFEDDDQGPINSKFSILQD